MSNQYKDISGFEGLYMVNDLGEVLNIKRNSLLRPGIGTTGYFLVILCKDGERFTKKVHRLVANAFVPNPENLPFVNHIDSNRLNNSVINLEWCDNSGNMRHCFDKGRGKIPVMNGEKNVNAKVTESLVREIRDMYSSGLIATRISEKLSLSLSLVYRIVKRQTWAHVA